MDEISAGIVGTAGAVQLGSEQLAGNSLLEGEEYMLKVDAKDARGAGIGRVGSFVIFINNAKTRIGNIYKVKITKVHRTFAYAELSDLSKRFIGNGSLLEL